MKPGTFHYVVTLQPTVLYGQHFFTAPTIRTSEHCLVLGAWASQWSTNTTHVPFYRVVLRMLPFWYEYFSIEEYMTGPEEYISGRRFISRLGSRA